MNDAFGPEKERPAIPEEAYHFLPAFLKELTDHFTKWYERDVFLTSMLSVLSAALPSVRFQYGKDELSPHLFSFVVAAAASGKGAVGRAFRLLDLVDEHLMEKSASEHAAWRAEMDAYERALRSRAGEKLEHPGLEPLERTCTVGEDTTLAKLVERLSGNPQGVFMGSTEADSIAQAMGQQHGGFGHVLRKVYHHEPVIQDRKTSRSLRIVRPRLALALAGTPSQVSNLMDGVSDGLFSRFAIYEYTAPLQYESQRPSREDDEFAGAVRIAQERVFKLYTLLQSRSNPLRFKVSAVHWERVDAVYDAFFQSVFGSESECEPESLDLAKQTVSPLIAASIKRGALIVFRIMAILSVWRCFERGDDLISLGTVQPNDCDVDAAIGIGLVYSEHAIRLALHTAPVLGSMPDLTRATGNYRMSDIQRDWWARLPGRFDPATAEGVGLQLFRSRATIYRWIDRFIKAGLLLRSDSGRYIKTSPVGCETHETLSEQGAYAGIGLTHSRNVIMSTALTLSPMSHSSHRPISELPTAKPSTTI